MPGVRLNFSSLKSFFFLNYFPQDVGVRSRNSPECTQILTIPLPVCSPPLHPFREHLCEQESGLQCGVFLYEFSSSYSIIYVHVIWVFDDVCVAQLGCMLPFSSNVWLTLVSENLLFTSLHHSFGTFYNHPQIFILSRHFHPEMTLALNRSSGLVLGINGTHLSCPADLPSLIDPHCG